MCEKTAIKSGLARRVSHAFAGLMGHGGYENDVAATKMTEKESFVLETRLLLQHLAMVDTAELHKVRRDVRRTRKFNQAGLIADETLDQLHHVRVAEYAYTHGSDGVCGPSRPDILADTGSSSSYRSRFPRAPGSVNPTASSSSSGGAAAAATDSGTMGMVQWVEEEYRKLLMQ